MTSARAVLRSRGGVLLVACVLIALVAAPAIAQSATQQPVLDGIAAQYRDASRLWRPRLLPVAQQLFMVLAGIEFAVSGALWALRRDSLDDIAAQFVLVLIESYIVLGGGVLFLGFAAFRGTAAFADNLIAYTFGVGVKVFLLYLIVGLGSQIAKSWIPLIQSSTFFGPTSPLLEVLGGALIFAVLAVRVPHVVAHRLSGHASFGIAHAIRALS